MITAECEHCLAEYDAKRSTSRFCGPKCKQAFYRNRMKPNVTLRDAKSVTVTKAESHVDASDITMTKAIHRLIPKMTVMERLFYRPAHLLKPGETNFVSLPGRACYGGA